MLQAEGGRLPPHRERESWQSGRRLLSGIASPDNELISRAEAQRLAAREIAAERKRTNPALHHPTAPGAETVTVKNAREVLLRRLAGLAERMRAAAGILPQRDAERAPSAPGVRKTSAVPTPRINKVQLVPDEPPADQTIGVYTGNAGGAHLIGEDEYTPSMRSPVYANWIHSVRDAERRARERQNRWIG